MERDSRYVIIFTVVVVCSINMLFYQILDLNKSAIVDRRHAIRKRVHNLLDNFIFEHSSGVSTSKVQSIDITSNTKRNILTMSNEENSVELNSNPIKDPTYHLKQRIMNSDEGDNRILAKRRSMRHNVGDRGDITKRPHDKKPHITHTEKMHNSNDPVSPRGTNTDDNISKNKSIAQIYNPIKTMAPPTLNKSAVEEISGNNISDNEDINSPITGINAKQTRSAYKYAINPKDVCNIPGSEGPYALILVLSKHEHFERRNAIRETWGNIAKTKHTRLVFAAGKLVRLVFVLGISHESHWRHFIHSESATYHDILQGNILEDYRSLTHKSLLALEWVIKSCPTVNFIVKSDDDTFINVPHLVKTLQKQTDESVLIGALNPHSKVPRQGLWNTTREEWPADYFPPYCSGVAYAMSTRTAVKLLEAPPVPLIHLEDVYITGILAKAASINPKGVEGFSSWISDQLNICDVVKDKIITSHHITPEIMYQIWNQLGNKSALTKCGN